MKKARPHVPRMRLAGVGLVLVLFAACGDDANVTTPPTTPPPTPVPPTPVPATLLIQGERALEGPNERGIVRVANWDFTAPEGGTLEITIGYLHDDSQILVWVTDRLCNKWQFERDECFYLTRSLEGSRPRMFTVTGVEAGGYSLFVANDGPHDEQIGYEVLLRPGPSGS